jgi:hypothetical protein
MAQFYPAFVPQPCYSVPDMNLVSSGVGGAYPVSQAERLDWSWSPSEKVMRCSPTSLEGGRYSPIVFQLEIFSSVLR